MRKTFYKFFSNYAPSVVGTVPEKIYEKLVPDKTEFYDISSRGSQRFDCVSCGESWDEYLLVMTVDGVFYDCLVRKVSKTHMGAEISPGSYDWELSSEVSRTDFCDLTIMYGLVVKSVCETFGYEEVIKHISAGE